LSSRFSLSLTARDRSGPRSGQWGEDQNPGFQGRSHSVCVRKVMWLVINVEFRPAASYIGRGAGELDRLAARIGHQTERE
jgi:hypothetical protein